MCCYGPKHVGVNESKMFMKSGALYELGQVLSYEKIEILSNKFFIGFDPTI